MALVLVGAPPAHAQDWTEWQLFATLTFPDGGAVALQVQTRAGGWGPGGHGNTQVRWRVVNSTNSTLFDVAIDDKIYRCINGSIHSSSGESVSREISGGGGTRGTLPDPIDSTECPDVIGSRFEDVDNILRFRLLDERSPRGWGEYGTVTGVALIGADQETLQSNMARADRADGADGPDETDNTPTGFRRLATALGLGRERVDATGAGTTDDGRQSIRITSHTEGERVTSRIVEIAGEADPRAGDEVTVQFADVRQRARLEGTAFRSSVVLQSGRNDIRVCQLDNCSILVLDADIPALGLMATLSWTGGGDLDLHVETPRGEHCFYSAKSVSGACELDIDDRSGVNPENVSIPADGSRGQYRFWVVNYGGGYGSRGELAIYREGILVESTSFVANVGDGQTIVSRHVNW